MNTMKNMSMYRYICYASIVILFLCGLTLVLSACEDNLHPVKQGKTVTVQFSIGNALYTGDEVMTRGSDTPDSETVVVKLDDDMYMLATLEADPESESQLRAYKSAFVQDAKVCFVAYQKSDGQYAGHAVYSIDGDSLKWVSGTSTSVGYWELPGDVAYNFAAYTYTGLTDAAINTPTTGHAAFFGKIPAPDSIPAILPESDLMYGVSLNHTLTNNNRNVTIPMTHMFSMIKKTQATVSLATPAPRTIALRADHNMDIVSCKANLTMPKAVPSAISKDAASALVKYRIPNGKWVQAASDILSVADTCLVYPGTKTIVEIGNITVNGQNYSNRSAAFESPLVSGKVYSLRLTFTPQVIPPDSGDPIVLDTYVGAFWRNNQIGERIIRIPVSKASITDTIPWKATVAWYDNRPGCTWNPGGGDGIVLAAGKSPDPNVNYNTVKTPGNAENYKVTGSNTINGYVTKNDTAILFRIGLQKTFTAYNATTNPARYALVLIYFGKIGNEKVQKLFLRQGEGADYLMRNEDPFGPATGANAPANRTECVRFSPYNLTYSDSKWSPAGTGANVTDHPQLPLKGGVFVEYPTQSGAHFQWSAGAAWQATYARRAFHPGILSGITPWNITGGPDIGLKTGFWTSATDRHDIISETCPNTYRRPNDGPTAALVDFSNVIATSEMRQSLWLNPQNAAFYEMSNVSWGYYADGFFDRRQITSSHTVSSGSWDVACRGILFYNPVTNASLFFPVSGMRDSSSGGELHGVGDGGYYWSSSAHFEYDANFLYLPLGRAGMSEVNRCYGHSIRCVKNDTPIKDIDVENFEPGAGDSDNLWVMPK